MKESIIKEIVKHEKPLLFENDKGNLFFYLDKFRMLIPIQQEGLLKEYGINAEIKSQKCQLKSVPFTKELIKSHQAIEVFGKLKKTFVAEIWKLASTYWFVDNSSQQVMGIPRLGVAYNGYTNKIEVLGDHKAHILRVIYLHGSQIFNGNKISLGDMEKYYGLTISDRTFELITLDNEIFCESSNNNMSVDSNVSSDIQALLDCDKKRCGLASYEKEMLYDIKAGHWDVFEGTNQEVMEKGLVARNPRLDIKKNGVIGIDFGTKSTVVVKQEGSNEIRPIRIGSLSLKAEVLEQDYENPTIISCFNINNFLEHYNAKEGRPDTSCEDLFVSYNAYEGYKHCPTENFYAYYSELKQWANSEKEDAVVQDTNKKEKYQLGEECSIEKKILNPVEIYAYYIGMYINNMRNGIYLKYIMSFPVKYSKSTKELIRKSFEKGLKKSLPKTIVEDSEIMSKFSVDYQISEPAAYAVTALEQSGFKPIDEKEKYLYGIFDFGGGTTDFDFGVWRGANDEEYDKYNCDYVLECFGADSDVRLGGENILEMLAYNVFKANKNMAAKNKIACALPVDQTAFIGGEHLIRNSQSANRNLTSLKEKLRPLWEQHENWKENYCKKNLKQSKENEGEEKKEEYIEALMYNFNGEPVPNCKFDIDTQQLIELIKQRIQKGVDAFFKCIEKSILGNSTAQFASEKIYIFLAGNSCKSAFVKEIFENTINTYNKEYEKIDGKEQDRFVLIEPLVSVDMEKQYVPNAKTSVAYGLVKSRPGGKIYVKKNYETDSTEETRFKYYLGTDRRGGFECKLAPMVNDEKGEDKTSYGIWHKFQGAGMGVARLYYTEDPRADSKAERLIIENIPFHEVSFEPEEDKYVFVRAVKPSVIEYTIAASIEDIGDKIQELDIDKY